MRTICVKVKRSEGGYHEQFQKHHGDYLQDDDSYLRYQVAVSKQNENVQSATNM